MRELFKILPLGLGLPVVIGAASVKPEDAASNLAAWTHLAGVEHVPSWLNSPAIDGRVINGSLAIGVIYAFVIWGIPAIKRRSAKSTIAAVTSTSVAPISAVGSFSVPADWPLQDLFTHINPDLLDRTDDGVGDTWEEIGNDIKDAFALGRLNVWGRPYDAGFAKLLGERQALRKVDPSYWHFAHFTFSFFDNTADGAPQTYVESGHDQIIYTDLRVSRAEALSIWPQSTQNPLRIVLGYGGEFETRESAGLYKTNHTFSACVENRDEKRFLSNCKFYLNIANEKDHTRQDYALQAPFTLNPTEKNFRSIVSYREPATISKHAGDFIQLHIPIGFGYGVGYSWPWRLPVGAYTFSLHATSRETSPVEVVCKIWVDVDGKLHFEKA